jgi:hypothetical protein
LLALPRDNQGESRVASSKNAPERAKHCLNKMLPSPRYFVNPHPFGIGDCPPDSIPGTYHSMPR